MKMATIQPIAVSMTLLITACKCKRDCPDPSADGTEMDASTTDGTASGSSTSATDESQTTSTSTGSDDTAATSSTSSAFIVPWDAPNGGIIECNIWDQDCPPGEKCTVWSNVGGEVWNAVRCAPIDDNPGQPGDECTTEGSATSGIDDCDLGSLCWNVDLETNMGTCVALCTGDEGNPMCDNPDDTCSLHDPLALCLPSCDPLIQDCPIDQVCHPSNDHSESLWVCSREAAGDLGNYGDACEYFNVCNPGLVCLADAVPDCEGANQCCTEICALDSPSGNQQCEEWGEGQMCRPWYTPGTEPPGLENVGYCGLL